MQIGYARVSTPYQPVDEQVNALKEAGCAHVYQEVGAGVTDPDLLPRELTAVLQYVQKGDVFVVTQLDRLTSHQPVLDQLLSGLQQQGISVRVLAEPRDSLLRLR